VYARRVKGEVLEFGHRGWLYEESFLFYDFKTDSLWLQATGTAVHGALKGTRLERLPSTQTTWKEWRTLHPDTKVLSRPAIKNMDFWYDSYTSYYQSGKGIKYDRKGPLHFGLALVLNDAQKLYPFSELEKTPVVNDVLDGQPVLVVFHPASRTAVAFARGFIFELAGMRADDVLLKAPNGSIWSGLTGRRTDTLPLKEVSEEKYLRQLPATQFVVENWPLHYPKGLIYGRRH
jgi:hypothetical protein